MEKLFQKVYDSVICYEPDMVQMDREVEKKVGELMERYRKLLSEEELEELKNLLYGVVTDGEKKGFLLGAKYTAKALFFLLE